jgi:hypothetical protein
MQSIADDNGGLIHFLYEIAGLSVPEIRFVNDPISFKQEIGKLREARCAPVNVSITTAVMDRIAGPCMTAIKSALTHERYQQHMNQHWFPLQRKWHDGVRSLVGERFEINPGTWSNHPDCSDYAWMNYIRSFEGIEIPSLTDLYFSTLEKTRLTGSYLTKDVAVILSAPKCLHIDPNHRPHAENGFAIEFETSGLCAWKGLLVPDSYILNKDAITKQDILNERNVELRRALMEIIGPKRFSSLLDLETIDQSIDAQGNLQSLYRTREKDNLINAHLFFAHVVCPSTQRTYYLPVPPHLTTAQDAVAWTFGLDGDTYHPSVET